MGANHNKVGNYGEKRSDMILIPNLRDNIVPYHMLNKTYVQN